MKKLTDKNGFHCMSTWQYMGREKEAILPKSLIDSHMTLTDQVCMVPLFNIVKCTVSRLFEVDVVKDVVTDLTTRLGSSSTDPLHVRFLYKVARI